MKKHILNILFLFFVANSFAQKGLLIKSKINNSKEKVLILREDSISHKKKILLYDILNDKIIVTLNYPSNYQEFDFSFSSNSKVFSVLAEYTDTNFKHKDWKPNRYYIGYYKGVSEDSGWHIDKAVTLSTLNFYDANSGTCLFNLKESTGFYYYERDNGTAPFELYGNYKVPTYIFGARFIPNSDSIIGTYIIPDSTGFKYKNGEKKYIKPYCTIWDLTTRKKIGKTTTNVEDLISSKDKKYLFSVVIPSYRSISHLKYEDLYTLENDANNCFVYLYNEDLSEKEYLPKLNINEYKIDRNQKYITDSVGKEFIITSISEKINPKGYGYRTVLKHFQVNDLSGKLVWTFNKPNCLNLKFKRIPQTDEIYYCYQKDSKCFVEIVNFKKNITEKIAVFSVNSLKDTSMFELPQSFLDSNNKLLFTYSIHPFIYDKNTKRKVFLFKSNDINFRKHNNQEILEITHNEYKHSLEYTYEGTIFFEKKGYKNSFTHIDYLCQYFYKNDSVDIKKVTREEILNTFYYKKYFFNDTSLIFCNKVDWKFDIIDAKTSLVLNKGTCTTGDAFPCLTIDNNKILILEKKSKDLNSIYNIRENKLTNLKDIK